MSPNADARRRGFGVAEEHPIPKQSKLQLERRLEDKDVGRQSPRAELSGDLLKDNEFPLVKAPADSPMIRRDSVGDMVRAFELLDREKLAASQERHAVYLKLPARPAAAEPAPALSGRQRRALAIRDEQDEPKKRESPQKCPIQEGKLEIPEGKTQFASQRPDAPNAHCSTGYCITIPGCRIEVQDGWVRIGVMFQDPCNFFAKCTEEFCESAVQQEEQRPRTPMQRLRQGASDAVGSRAVRATALGAVGGGAALGTVGAVGGAAAGGSLGALAGLLAAPLTLGLSVPLGAALGSGTGLCAGAATAGAAGSVGGGVLGLLGYKCRGIPSAVLERVGAKTSSQQPEAGSEFTVLAR